MNKQMCVSFHLKYAMKASDFWQNNYQLRSDFSLWKPDTAKKNLLIEKMPIYIMLWSI